MFEMFEGFEVPIAIGIEMFKWFEMFEELSCSLILGFDCRLFWQST